MELQVISEISSSDWKGCLMLSIPEGMSEVIRNFSFNNFKSEDLVDDGIEEDVHCTVAYGFPQDADLEKVKKVIAEFDTSFNLTCDGISRFECDGYDVMNIDVICSELSDLNIRLSDIFDISSEFGVYIPHITLAYVKKGTYKKLEKKSTIFSDVNITCNEMIYSKGDSENRERQILKYENFCERQNRGFLKRDAIHIY